MRITSCSIFREHIPAAASFLVLKTGFSAPFGLLCGYVGREVERSCEEKIH